MNWFYYTSLLAIPLFTTAQVIQDLALLDPWRTVCSLEYGFDLIRKGWDTIYMNKEDW